MAAELTVWHGTDIFRPGVMDVINGLVPLFSYLAPGYLGFSGSLIDTLNVAIKFARKRGNDRGPAVLEYSIPYDLIVPVGRPVGHDGIAYITNIAVEDTKELTDNFLKNIEYSRKALIDQVNRGIITFHKVPYQYLRDVKYL